MDETPFQLLDEVRKPVPMKPAKPLREDSEYERNGTCSIFIFTEPLVGWRHVEARKQRTRVDWAEQVRELLEVHYPHAVAAQLPCREMSVFFLPRLTVIRDNEWRVQPEAVSPIIEERRKQK
ncbi:MAG: transposase [Roseiflexus sp.]|nr:transposase [Roseiflexus sp.]